MNNNTKNRYSLLGFKEEIIKKIIEIIEIKRSSKKGRKNSLTAEVQVLIILEKLKNNLSNRYLAKKYNVNESTIRRNISFVLKNTLEHPEFSFPSIELLKNNKEEILILDVTEIPVQRIKKTKNYIQEKKRNTLSN